MPKKKRGQFDTSVEEISYNVMVDGNEVSRDRVELIYGKTDEGENADCYSVYEGEPGDWRWIADCGTHEVAEILAKAIAERNGGKYVGSACL